MVDMEYDSTQISYDQVQDILQWVERKSQDVIRPRTINFPYLLNEDQLKAVIHVLNAIGHRHNIEIETYTNPFTTQIAVF